jgi:hypothetical protein
MRFSRVLLSGIVAAGMVAAPLSPAFAGWRHHYGHPGLIGGLFGFAGGVMVGAATIATAPLAIVAGAAAPSGYYGPPPQAYAPQPTYQAAPGYYYGPPRGYYAPAPYGPPAYGPAPQYSAPPPSGYYGPPPGN